MYLKSISIGGILLVALLLLAAGALLWLIDRGTLKKMLAMHIHLPRLPIRIWLVVVLAMLSAGCALSGCLMLSLPSHPFWYFLTVVMAGLLMSTPHAMTTYLRSLKHTESHRLYLLANGATHLECIMPGVRRSLRAAVLPLLWQRSSAMPLAMLLLLCGLTIGGFTLAAALVMTIMTWAAVLAASVLAAVLSIWLADRQLFDKHGNFIGS